MKNWKGNIKDIISEYDESNIFNCDETWLCWNATTDRSLVLSGDDCQGNKKFKERVTLLLRCSLIGEKLKPFVIGKYENSRFLRSIRLEYGLIINYSTE